MSLNRANAMASYAPVVKLMFLMCAFFRISFVNCSCDANVLKSFLKSSLRSM